MKFTDEQRAEVCGMILMYAEDPGPSGRDSLIDAIEEMLSEADAPRPSDMSAYYTRLRNEALT